MRRRRCAGAATTSPCSPRPRVPPTCSRAAARSSEARSATSSRSAPPSRSRAGARRRCRSACAPTSRPRSRSARFDVVHGFEPGLPSLSYLALLEAETLDGGDVLLPRAARRTRRARTSARQLLARVDALLATSADDGRARGRALPGRLPSRSRSASTPTLFAPAAKRQLIVVELEPGRTRRRPSACCGSCASCPAGRSCSLRTTPLDAPADDPARRSATGCASRSARDAATRAARAPGRGGDLRAGARAAARGCVLEARASGCAIAEPAERRRPARARSRRGGAARRGRRAARERRRGGARAGRAAELRPASPSELDARLRDGSPQAAPARRRARRRRPARRPRLDRRRPPHAHRLVARLLDRRRRPARPRRGRSGSARSPSPITTSSAARSRRSSSPATAS